MLHPEITVVTHREKAWDRGPSLAFLKASNQTCIMAGNTCLLF